MKLNSSPRIFEKKKAQISNFIKIRPMGAELFHADGWMDRHEVNSRFSQFFERA
jgi:hypothetical protein